MIVHSLARSRAKTRYEASRYKGKSLIDSGCMDLILIRMSIRICMRLQEILFMERQTEIMRRNDEDER